MPAGLAARVGVVLVFGVVLTPTLGGVEGEPVAYVGDPPGPGRVHVGMARPSAEPFDDLLHLEELHLRVLLGVGAGD